MKTNLNGAMWYFRKDTDISEDDDEFNSMLLPTGYVTGITPGNNSITANTSTVTIHFEKSTDKPINDKITYQNGYITLTIVSKKIIEVMQFLARSSADTATPLVIHDEVTGETASPFITGVSYMQNG